MSFHSRAHRYEERKFGSQKEPLLESVNSRFGRTINVGDPVVTFTQSGRGKAVGKGIFKGIMRVETWYRPDPDTPYKLSYSNTAYIVEREGGKRTKLHYEQSLCHADITVQDLIGHTI